jgi:cytochrome c553
MARPRQLACTAALLALAAAAPAAPPQDTMAQRVVACTACHGKEGRAAPDGYYPRIAGKPAGYLYNQLLNFRDGRRHYPLMSYLVEHLSDDYLREIAGHFAALELPYAASQPPALTAAQIARGRQLVLEGDAGRRVPACAQCHGRALTGTEPAVPGLLGLPRDYLNSQLGAWRTGLRRAQEPDCMAQLARQLAPEDISAVTGWLAAQPVPSDAKPAARPAGELPLRCGSAH